MGVVRYQIIQLEPLEQSRYGPVGRYDDAYDVHSIPVGDSTNLLAMVDLCARMTRTLCDEEHTCIWAVLPYFDSQADVTREDTVELFERDTPKVTPAPVVMASTAPPAVRVIRETHPIRPIEQMVSPKPWYDKRDIGDMETAELTPRWLLGLDDEEGK